MEGWTYRAQQHVTTSFILPAIGGRCRCAMVTTSLRSSTVTYGERLANRMTADSDMYELAEFVPLKPVDTAGWPNTRTLAEDEYLDEDRVVHQVHG